MKRKMRKGWMEKTGRIFRQLCEYLKDYRFSSILLKYFFLLFLCLVLPATVLNVWYGRIQREQIYDEVIKRNESSLTQAYNSVHSVIMSNMNLSYSLSANSNVRYLTSRNSVSQDSIANLDSLTAMLSVLKNADDYIDSIYIYFANSGEVVTNTGMTRYENFQDKEALFSFSPDMPQRNILTARIKENRYPYLLTISYPITVSGDVNRGLVVINLDVEKLGDYIGTGKYRNTDDSPRLFVFDEDMSTLVYSDEYRLLSEGNWDEIVRLRDQEDWEEGFSDVCTIWDSRYVVSGLKNEEDMLRYLYLSPMQEFEEKSSLADIRLLQIVVLTGLICLILAFFLAVWVYRPVRQTIRVLSEVSMLTEWDKKERLDEMEAIQRSILSAKKENDELNAQIQERIISLHNAQICALQTQINPHFLFNTLEAIANAAALLMNGDNKVTEMIYTLGQLMRISLSNENYLVPLKEELEHVKLYVKLVEFRFHGRITLHQELPESLWEERIVKLTLQPLIENSVQHGFARKRRGGNIWLRGEKKGGDTCLYVIDNGEGISEEELEKLRRQLNDPSIKGGRHIGMRNVNQRLKLVFGEEYGLSVSRAEEGGLCVAVRFHSI